MDHCLYFTNRTLEGKAGKGRAMVWVLRPVCEKCGKGELGKPLDKKTGKVKSRASVYVCKECGAEFDKKETEEKLLASIDYVCPECGHKAEKQIPFIRKKIQGVDALTFECDNCGFKIVLTKKFKISYMTHIIIHPS